MPDPRTIHEWDANPILNPAPGTPLGVSKGKIDSLIRCADNDKDLVKIVKDIVGATVGAAITTAAMVKHAAALNSTVNHLDNITSLNFNRCTCNMCMDVTDYIITKKSSKVVRRGARVGASLVPFANLGITVGEKLKGIYKLVKGTRKVNRKKFACILWITAKEGCPVAKGIVNELLGSPAKMMKAFSHYAGITAIAEKLSSK
jgi:hypothetical protein